MKALKVNLFLSSEWYSILKQPEADAAIDKDAKVENAVCDILCVHHEVINKYTDQLITLDRVNNLAELFKTLGDPTRIRIMDALEKSEFLVRGKQPKYCSQGLPHGIKRY